MKKFIIIMLVVLLLILIIIGVSLSVVLRKKDQKLNEISENVVLNNVSADENILDGDYGAFEKKGNVINYKEEAEFEEIIYGKTTEIKNATYFFTVQNCLEKYLRNIKEENNGIKPNSDLINILNILQLNIENNNIVRFALRAVLVDEEKQMYYFNTIVYLDTKNYTYSIQPFDNKVTNLEKVDLNKSINEIKLSQKFIDIQIQIPIISLFC